MKIESSVAFISLSVGIFCHISAGNFESARAIQIIKPENHSIQLELNDLKEILEADDIRDRQVVVVSIAGAMRKGKSFLLNFFIRYLYAQYKTHDVTDWLGENKSSNELVGFKWKIGKKPETTGIWMWSDIFTHDYENGEKVAIIVLDTQGSFEKKSSMQDTSAIFALSLMLSSVQCYNIKEQIQEDSLQYLDLFTDYARAALNQTNEKPFQYLLFIVRDWSFPYENSYGLNQQIVDELMAKNAEEMPETHQLRNRIQASFKKIGAFLMPHPGMIVAKSQNFTGHLQQIDTEFKQYLKVLVPLLFHPENVVIKSINGEKVRARDLLQYLQAYVDIFKGGTLPATSTLIEATAKASNTILLNDCLNLYVHSMQNAVNNVKPYFNQSNLLDAHGMAKDGSLTKFQQARKLGGEELISVFQQRTETAIEEQFLSFKEENERKRIDYIEKANLINDKISMEIRMRFERKLLEKTDDESDIDTTELNTLFATEKQNALDEFDQRKMGENYH
ncbi:atlastin-like [Sitodiplosis mosellana]|uniref:atlastin-like n=1 Tax=Sitodiplosis mosellana TaxID=263140 RepID=UPI002444E929|nr:atlastin-like [Sitodiplosis mosellana]